MQVRRFWIIVCIQKLELGKFQHLKIMILIPTADFLQCKVLLLNGDGFMMLNISKYNVTFQCNLGPVVQSIISLTNEVINMSSL